MPSTPPLSDWAAALQAAHSNPSGQELDRLLAGCREYLLAIARQEWPADLQAKENPSDLVQQTLAKAHRKFPTFKGDSQAEWLAWVRRILLNLLQNLLTYYHRDKRDVAREVTSTDGAGPAPLELIAGPDPTPHTRLQQLEQARFLDEALAGLPERYRKVIRLRHELDLSFTEVGRRLGCSDEAAQKLWGRAVKALKRRLGRHP